MSPSMKKYIHHLMVLATAAKPMRKAIIQTADPGLIKCLCEYSLNLIKGNVPLSPMQKKTLTRSKKQLRQLADKSVPLKIKKNILQRGGAIFLPRLLDPLAKKSAMFLAPLAYKVVKAYSESRDRRRGKK